MGGTRGEPGGWPMKAAAPVGAAVLTTTRGTVSRRGLTVGRWVMGCVRYAAGWPAVHGGGWSRRRMARPAGRQVGGRWAGEQPA